MPQPDDTETPPWLKIVTLLIVLLMTAATIMLTLMVTASAIRGSVGAPLIGQFGEELTDYGSLWFLIPCSLGCSFISVLMLRDG